VTTHVATVFLEGWEVEAWQGENEEPAFEVGSEVEWGLFPVTAKLRSNLLRLLGTEVGGSISHLEAQQHRLEYEQPVPTRGRIASIRVAYWKLRPAEEHVLEPAPGTAVFHEREHLNAYDEWLIPGIADHRFGGFIVELVALQ
jgi:hypothetical protein